MNCKNMSIISILMLQTLFQSVQAQQYELQVISLPASGYVSVIDMNNSGEILGTLTNYSSQDYTATTCPFYYNRNTTLFVNLCNYGFQDVYDINNGGSVVGSSKEIDPDKSYYGKHALAWNYKTGTRDIGKLNNDDNFSIAIGINDKNQIIGASGKLRNVKVYDEIYYRPFPQAFIYTPKRGIQKIIKGVQNSFPVAINNRGEIVLAQETSPENYRPSILRRDGLKHRMFDQYGQDMFISFSPEASQNFGINDRGVVVFNRLKFTANSTRGSKLTARLPVSERGDYGYHTNVNLHGTAVGMQDAYGWIYSDKAKDRQISCLFPQSQHVAANDNMTFSELRILEIGAINDRNEILATAVLEAGTTMIVIKPISLPDMGRVTNYCPFYNVLLDKNCKQAVRREGGACTVTVKLDGDIDILPVLSAEVYGRDYILSSGETCTPDGLLSRSILEQGKAITQATFYYSPKRTHNIGINTQDDRFKFTSRSLELYNIRQSRNVMGENEFGTDDICDNQ